MSSTGNKQKNSFYISSLDGLRAVSIGIVFLSHAGLGHIIPGAFGVTIFFFLSGYLITTLMRMEKQQTGRISLMAFYQRRALRIFPPLYITLLFAVPLALVRVLPGKVTTNGVLAQLFYIANYYEIYSQQVGWVGGTGVLWSLAVEEHFYFVFPLFFLLLARYLPRASHQTLVLAGICLGVVTWRLILVSIWGYGTPQGSQAWARVAQATDTRLDSLLYGCILAIYANPILDRTNWSAFWWCWVWFPIGLLALAATFLIRHDYFRETVRYSIQGLSLFPIFIASIRYPDWGVFKWLNRPLVRFIGVLSYSLYLTHHVIIEGVRFWLPDEGIGQGVRVASYVLALLLSLGVSLAMYYGIERPLSRWRKRLSRVSSPQLESVI